MPHVSHVSTDVATGGATETAPPDHQRAERIATLVEAIARIADPAARAQAEELIGEVLALYGDGLARIMELAASARTAGESLIATFAADELIGSLLLLHGLHPDDLPTRVARALSDLRPHLASLGAEVELLGIEEAVARLRLRAGGRACATASSTTTVTRAIEDALYAAAPELDRLEIEGSVEPPPRLITLTPTPKRRARTPEAAAGAGTRDA